MGEAEGEGNEGRVSSLQNRYELESFLRFAGSFSSVSGDDVISALIRHREEIRSGTASAGSRASASPPAATWLQKATWTSPLNPRARRHSTVSFVSSSSLRHGLVALSRRRRCPPCCSQGRTRGRICHVSPRSPRRFLRLTASFVRGASPLRFLFSAQAH